MIDKKELFSDIVCRVYKRAYPKLFKANKLFLDKPQIFFDTSKILHINKWYSEDTENRDILCYSSTTIASFLSFSNTIIVHLESAYKESLSLIWKEDDCAECDNSIENVMFTVIVDALIEVLTYYHSFTEIELQPDDEYINHPVISKSTIFKLKYYDFLVTFLNCDPKILFRGNNNIIQLLDNDLISTNSDLNIAAKQYLNYRNKMDGYNFKYVKYKETDELNLISRYIYASYMFRYSMITYKYQSSDPENHTIYNSHIENKSEIKEILNQIEGCRGRIKYIKMINDVDWESIIHNLDFKNVTISSDVDLTLTEKLRPKQCKSVSKFLNLLPFPVNMAFSNTDEQIELLNDSDLYKAITKDRIPRGYSWLLTFIKLIIDVDDDTLYVRTKILDTQNVDFSEATIYTSIV